MKISSSPYWVLVADSGRARIFALKRKPAEFREVQELLSDSRHKTNTELMTDASGRTADVKGGPSSHTLQPRSDAHNLAEQAFSSRLADYLEQAAGRKLFERLVVIADPSTLGRLRQLMSKPLASVVIDEVNRDLVGLPPDELERRVRAELGWPD